MTMKIAFYHYFWPHLIQNKSDKFDNKISEYLVIYNLAKSLEEKGQKVIRYSKIPPHKYISNKDIRIFRYGLIQIFDLLKFFFNPPDIFGIVSKSIYNSKSLIPLIRIICKLRKVKFLIFMGHDESTTSMKILKDVEPYKYDEKVYWKNEKDYNNRIEINKLYRPKSKNEYVIVPSSIIKNNCIKEGLPEKNIIILPHGTDTNYFKPKQNKSDIRVIRILFAGNGATRKGLPYLIKAYEKLRIKYPVTLTILSHNIKDLKIPDIKLLKDVNDGKLLKLYQTHDIFVLPSLLDGWGLTASEAMSCELPVIVSELTGISDIIKNDINGYVVNAKNSEQIFKAIVKLIVDPEKRCKIASQARKTILTYQWDHISTIFIKQLKKINDSRLVERNK